jgi:hypothetical protein
MKEKLKDLMAIALILLSIGIALTIGFMWPKEYLGIEIGIGVIFIGIISLMHRK